MNDPLYRNPPNGPYEACPACSEKRKAGEFGLAANCFTCGGRGFRQTPESHICNKCGESMWLASGGPYGTSCGLKTQIGGGYSSPHLTDLTTYAFKICEKCLRDLFSSFKIPPTTSDQDGGWDYAKDLEYYNQLNLKRKS